MIPHRRQPTVLIVALFFSSLSAFACQVPVFRYALERWPADPYELAVFFRDSLSPEQTSTLESVPSQANLEVVTIDVNEMTVAEEAIYGSVSVAESKTVARLYYPRTSSIETPIWEGELTDTTVATIVDSPARKEIRRRILSGVSAVWVIVGQSEPEPDLEKRLVDQLTGIAESMEIPEGVVGPGNLEQVASGEVAMEDVLRSKIPLKISFDVLHLDRADPAEETFISSLFGISAEALAEHPDAPMLFPIFGRGRTIDGVPAPLANEGLLTGACQYLCGACSCEVKKENPGIDLLMSADWDAAVAGNQVIIDKSLPPLSGAGDLVSSKAAPTAPVTEVGTPAPPSPERPNHFLRNAGILAGVFIGFIVLMSFALKKKFQ